MSDDVIVVGAGLAGLTCAKNLTSAGRTVHLLEASDDVGGRVRTDEVEGFLIDRGFQVLLDSYEVTAEEVDLEALELRAFDPGALVRQSGRFIRVVDPWRRPSRFLTAAFSPFATFSDKRRLLGLRRDTARGPQNKGLMAEDERTTAQELESRGFSERVMKSFFGPFFRGVFLEPDLATSSRFFQFVFGRFARGNATLPSAGMGALPRQLVDGLPEGTLSLNTPVASVASDHVVLEDRERLDGKVVLATDRPRAMKLLGKTDDGPVCGTTCLSFAADQAPLKDALLVLNGDGDGPVNNLCVPSNIAPTYAPKGAALISVSVLGVDHAESLVDAVRTQLTGWFGNSVASWRHLRNDVIPFALPGQAPGSGLPRTETTREHDAVLLCGDHCYHASIEGAITSGRDAARQILGG